MHRRYSQTEPNLLKYELNDLDNTKASTSNLFLNRSNSSCQHKHKFSDWLFVPPFHRRQTGCDCRLAAGCHVCRVPSDETALDRRVRRSHSVSSSGNGKKNSLVHIGGVQRSSSQVTLCRKRANTRLCIMASQSPPLEISSADSIKQTQSRGFVKSDFDDCVVDEDEDEMYEEANTILPKVESLPVMTKDENLGACRKKTAPNKVEVVGGATSASKREKTHHQSKQHPTRCLTAPQDECGVRSKPQLDKIFTRSERFGSSSSNLATDFSRALLNNLLQRGKEASLEFETSHAGTFSNTHVDGRDQEPTDSSVEQLATKIVQRINQVKESKCNYFQFTNIRGVFDKLIAASPNLSHHLQRLKDLYMPSSTDPLDTSHTTLNHPDSVARLERLEEELKEQASLLYKLLAELESLKEQNVRLTEHIENETETLAEMNTFKNLLLGQEKSVEKLTSKK